jgi:hypothetical protein
VVGRDKRSILKDNVKCVLCIRSEKIDTFVKSALFHFTKFLFWEVPFSDELLDYLRAVSEV